MVTEEQLNGFGSRPLNRSGGGFQGDPQAPNGLPRIAQLESDPVPILGPVGRILGIEPMEYLFNGDRHPLLNKKGARLPWHPFLVFPFPERFGDSFFAVLMEHNGKCLFCEIINVVGPPGLEPGTFRL